MTCLVHTYDAFTRDAYARGVVGVSIVIRKAKYLCRNFTVGKEIEAKMETLFLVLVQHA